MSTLCDSIADSAYNYLGRSLNENVVWRFVLGDSREKKEVSNKKLVGMPPFHCPSQE